MKKKKITVRKNEAYNKIVEFTKNNNLEFESEDSNLNGNCTILAGFCCYLNEKHDINLNENDIIDIVEEEQTTTHDFSSEFKKCYNFASSHSYENFWNTKEAHKMYKF